MDPGCDFCVVLSLRANVLNVSGVIGEAAEIIKRAAAPRPKICMSPLTCCASDKFI